MITALSRLKSPSNQWRRKLPLFQCNKKKKGKIIHSSFSTRNVVILFALQGATLVHVFQSPVCLPPSWILAWSRRSNWNDSSPPETGNSPHSSWAAATSWSPVWRGCGPGWTGWFCPCTVVDAGWFLPAPSGLPLTAILKFRHLTNSYKWNKRPYKLK